MIKICHVTTVHPNRYDVRIFEKECTTLAKNGYDVTLIVNDKLQDEERNGVKIVSLRMDSRSRVDRAIRVANKAFSKAEEVDAEIYHIHDPELLGIAVKLRKRGKKVIFDSHEFTAMQILTKEYIPVVFRKQIADIYRRYEENRLRKLSGLVMPCLYDGKDYFSKVRIPKVIIGNLPIISQTNDLCDTYEKKDKVCYVGSITESRGIFHMIKAAFLAGKKLVLIGDMPLEMKQMLEQMPEYSNVEYLGVLSHDVALHEMSKCAVGLALLQDEGQYSKLGNLPTKLYEYMMLGIPAVISNFSFYEKILKNYEFGIACDPSDDLAIANAINIIINDKKKQKRMSEAGINAIRLEMNWQKEAEKLLKLYREI